MMDKAIQFSSEAYKRLISTVHERFPKKSFGYLVSDNGKSLVTDFLLFEHNDRNDGRWRGEFESRGRYFVKYRDAGFVATPEETWRIQKEMWSRGLVEVAVFHTHRRHPANFSNIDYDLHLSRFASFPHVIISLRNASQPQLRAFSVASDGVKELTIAIDGRFATANRLTLPLHNSLDWIREVLALDGAGRPRCRNSQLVLHCIGALLSTARQDAIEDLLGNGFLREVEHRYAEYIESNMVRLNAARFLMGTSAARARHFCGEVPQHSVELSPFSIGRFLVTNELLGLLDESRLGVPAATRSAPAVNVSWFDAVLFALWVGCRLPTEAEWEYACSAGSDAEWCCENEFTLPEYAWFSENADNEVLPVGMRQANGFGIFDMHGNAWEWCQDTYDQDYYGHSSVKDPVRDPFTGSGTARLNRHDHRCCRGGSVHALAEMCRTRYRLHEPPRFLANDLGFRLAHSPITSPYNFRLLRKEEGELQ
jgi:formylglycine-generating enzyme required for sulfatase activity/proteasome lid subunit RPN8/RPN11